MEYDANTQLLEDFDGRVENMEKLREIAVQKGLEQRKALYAWNTEINAKLDQMNAKQQTMEKVGIAMVVGAGLLACLSVAKGGWKLFKMFQRRKTTTNKTDQQNSGTKWANNIPEMAQADSNLPPLRKRVHARDWRSSE
jgi:hypothetical protein